MTPKRHTQDTARNWAGRVIGPIVVEHCSECPRYMITLCQETGRKIRYPISGPIPEDCPLKKSDRQGRLTAEAAEGRAGEEVKA